jgi:roadblock/LC7 domain-containing protein
MLMMTYRHVSASETLVDGRMLKTFGAKIEMDPSAYAVLIACDRPPALLADKDFAAAGFTDEELKEYANSNSWASAPESFVAKVRGCWKNFAANQKAALDGNAATGAAPMPIVEPAPIAEPKKK